MRHLPEKKEVSRRPVAGRLLCVLLLTPLLLAPSRSCADAVFWSLSRGGSSPPAAPPPPAPVPPVAWLSSPFLLLEFEYDRAAGAAMTLGQAPRFVFLVRK